MGSGVYTHNLISGNRTRSVGRPGSLHLCQAGQELGLDLFGATLPLGSVFVDLGELEIYAVDHVVPTLDRGVVVCTFELIDHVLVELDLLDLGVDGRRRRFDGVELFEVGAVASCTVGSSVVCPADAENDGDDQGQ